MATKKYTVKASADNAVKASFADDLKNAKETYNADFKQGPYAAAKNDGSIGERLDGSSTEGMGMVYLKDKNGNISAVGSEETYDFAKKMVDKFNKQWHDDMADAVWELQHGADDVDGACGKKKSVKSSAKRKPMMNSVKSSKKAIKADWASNGKKKKISKSFELGDFFLFELGKDFIGISINNSYPNGKAWLGARTIKCADADGLFTYLQNNLTDNATWNQIERTIANSGFEAKIDNMGGFVPDKDMKKPAKSVNSACSKKRSVKASSVDGDRPNSAPNSWKSSQRMAYKVTEDQTKGERSFPTSIDDVYKVLGEMQGTWTNPTTGWTGECEIYERDLDDGSYIFSLVFGGNELEFDDILYDPNGFSYYSNKPKFTIYPHSGAPIFADSIEDFKRKLKKEYSYLKKVGDNVGASMRKPMRKTIKASSMAKRRASKRVMASDTSNDIVMYFEGNNVYQGSVYDLANAVENLCYDEDVNAKFQQWCNQFGDPFDFDGSPIDTASIFTDLIVYESEEAETHSDFYVDGDGILDFEIFYADDAVVGSTKTKGAKMSVKCSFDEGDPWEYQESYDYYYDEEPPAHIARELERLAKLTDMYQNRWFDKFEELHPGERFSSVDPHPDVDEAVGYTLDEAEYSPDDIKAATTDDELDPIMSDDFNEEDMGYGYTTNGEAISESMVDELCRIANEILEKSELAKVSSWCDIDRDSFDYWCDGSAYVSEKFTITFTYTAELMTFNKFVKEDAWWNPNAEHGLGFEINVKDGEIESVTYTDKYWAGNSTPLDNAADIFDMEALEAYIGELAAPVAMDIYNGTTNI